MAKGRKGGGRPGPGQVRGFRPGKEPPHLRKQQVKQQLGEGNWAQDKLIDAFAGRTPEEARRMMSRWRNGALAAGVALAVLALVLLLWSWIATVAVGALAGVAFFLWRRLEKQRASLEALAEMLGGRRKR